MNLFRYPFLAFFQPLELEVYLNANPALRKRVAWTHAAVIVGGFAATSVVTYLLLHRSSVDFLGDVTGSLIISLIIFGATLIIGFVAGGLSKRDNLVTFIVSTYWCFVIALLALLMWKLITRAEGSSTQDLWASAMIPLALIIVAMILVNLNGKTRGIRPAILLAFIFAIGFVLISSNTRAYVTLGAYQALESSQKLVFADGRYPGFAFSGLFPLSTEKLVYSRLQRDETKK